MTRFVTHPCHKAFILEWGEGTGNKEANSMTQDSAEYCEEMKQDDVLEVTLCGYLYCC